MPLQEKLLPVQYICDNALLELHQRSKRIVSLPLGALLISTDVLVGCAPRTSSLQLPLLTSSQPRLHHLESLEACLILVLIAHRVALVAVELALIPVELGVSAVGL